MALKPGDKVIVQVHGKPELGRVEKIITVPKRDSGLDEDVRHVVVKLKRTRRTFHIREEYVEPIS